MEKKQKYPVITEVIMILWALIIFSPIILLVMLSLKTDSQILMSPFAIPKELHFENYVQAFKQMQYLRVFGNTFVMTVGAVSIGVFINSMAAYAVMRAKKGKKFFKIIYYIFLVGYVLPGVCALVTLSLWLKTMGLNNSLLGIIFVFTGSSCAYGIFLISRFMNTIPISLEEAAFIDGATPIGIFFKIIFPLLKPATLTFIILRAVLIWNNFLYPLVLLQGKKSRTISLAVYFLRGEFIIEWRLIFAALVLSMIPITIFYMIFQKRIVGGLAVGAVKG